jgi:hypothetical protein
LDEGQASRCGDAQGDLEASGLEEFWIVDDATIAPIAPSREKGERGRNFVKEEKW